MQKPHSIAVVVSTYKEPGHLELVLKSLRRQTRPADQVVVAEDGQWEGNRDLVESFQPGWPGQLIHVTQQDNGCRLNASRNRGLAASNAEFVIIIDGDMVAEPHFVEDYLNWASPGRFIQARRIRLEKGITEDALARGRVDFKWYEPGITRRQQAIRSPWLSRITTKHDRSTKNTRGANFGFWRADLEAINGFDMEFINWGRNDIDTVARLLHNGVGRTYVRQAAIAFHLYHPGQSKHRVSVNQERFEQTLASRKTRCALGLDQIDQSE